MEDGRQTNGPLGKNLRAAGEGLLVFLRAMGVASPDPTHLDASTALCVFFSAMGRGALPAIAALKAEREILTRERRDLEEDRRRLMIEKSGRSAQTAEMMVRSQSLFYDLEKKIVDDLEKKIETIWSPVRLSDTWQPWQPDETGNRDKLKDNVPVNYIDRSSSSSYSDAETKPDSSSNNDDISDDKKTKPAKKGSPRAPSPGRAAALLSSFSSSSTSNSDSNDRLDDEKATVAATIITPPTVRDKEQRGGENGAQSMNKATPFQRVDDGFWGEVAEKDGGAMADNSYSGTYGEAGYGSRASEKLVTVRGKDFRHEKTKRKRSYNGFAKAGGAISTKSFSTKYQYSDEE